jgi:hypothetical protein
MLKIVTLYVLNQIQDKLKEYQQKEPIIPDIIFDKIKESINKRNMIISNIKLSDIAFILKYDILNNQLGNYLEHEFYIYNKIIDLPLEILTEKDIEDILNLRTQIEASFNKIKNRNDRKRMDTSFVLNKIFIILNKNSYSKCYELTNRKKLKQHEIWWKFICEDKGFEYDASILDKIIDRQNRAQDLLNKMNNHMDMKLNLHKKLNEK